MIPLSLPVYDKQADDVASTLPAPTVVRYSVRLDLDLACRLADCAEERGTTPAEMIRLAVAHYLGE